MGTARFLLNFPGHDSGAYRLCACEPLADRSTGTVLPGKAGDRPPEIVPGEGEIPPLVHGQKAADVRQLQEVPGTPEAVLPQPGVQRQHGQVDAAGPGEAPHTAGSSTSMFRFQAGSSPSQCHQFRSPAWKTVWPSAVTRKATPSSVEGSVSTGDAGQGSRRSPRRRAPGSRAAAFVREAPLLPVPVCQADALAQEEADIPLPVVQGKDLGVEVVLDGGGWQRPAGACPPAEGAGRPSTSQRAAQTVGSSTRKPLWSRKVTRHHLNFTAVP